MHVTRATGIIVGGWMILVVLGAGPAWGADPELVSAVSRKTHAAAGDFDIDLPLEPISAAVEGRVDGPSQVILTFSEAIQASDGTPDCSEVILSSGSCTGVSITGNEMTIDLAGATQEECLSLTVTGIQDTSGDPLTGDNDVQIRVLYGDRTGDGVVNIVDLNTAKQDLFDPLTASNFPSDVNADGVVNIVDLNKIKQNLFHTVPVCTPPVPPGMVLIPAGEFQMGDALNEGWPYEWPVHAVYVDAFFMDRYEVTNQQYADALNWAEDRGEVYVSEGVVYGTDNNQPYLDTHSVDSGSRIHWNGSTFTTTSGKGNHPMLEVSWYGAVAYANWRSRQEGRTPCYTVSGEWGCNFAANGYRLPTEAEWEKAARGGVAGHRFPWSDTDTIQHARANYYSSSRYLYDTSPTRGCHPLWGVGDGPYTSPVGFFTGALQYKADWGWPDTLTSYQTASGANGYGLYDMAGNAWEWCNDWYSGAYYSGSPYRNPPGPTSGGHRVLRGGWWGFDAFYCRVAYRAGCEPDGRDDHYGFRLALDSE